jgi:Zn-dependent peptidase ImmA (M78 family)
VLNETGHISTAKQIIAKKARWRVSAMALAYRLHKFGLLSEGTHRSICIELGKLGFTN